MVKTLPGKPIAFGRTAEIFAWERDQVLKLYFPHMRLEWVQGEAEITREIHAAGLPAPGTGEVIEVDGRYGIIFERVNGVSLLRLFEKQPWRIGYIATTLARLHAGMHAISLPDLPSQREDLIWQIQAAPDLRDTKKDILLSILDSLPDGDRVCHSDFHPDNIMITPNGPVIIDWMTAKRGNPVADVARTALIINNGAPVGDIPNRLLFVTGRRLGYWFYREQYARMASLNRRELARWLPVMAAARLNERVPGEQEWLLRLVDSATRQVESSIRKPVQSG